LKTEKASRAGSLFNKFREEKIMGRFSATVHIKDNAGRMRVINTFCEVMKKRGFVPCSEDEAALSYLLAFGEGWVTLANEEYRDNPQKAYDDSRQMAAALKTSAFSVEVVDSDFALLKLSDPDGGEDEVVVGDGSGYGIEEPTRGERQYWEKLLADGKTWEQFSETAAKNEVFVEDVLGELAGVLGIEPYYICADFDEVSDKSDENKNITAFYFKKAGAKGKPMSLNAAFKKVFGEALEPLGYKLIKSKHPYFVRVVTDEIIHVISYYNYKQCYDRDHNNIVIKGGVATVYRSEIDLTHNPRRENWLTTNCSIYIYRLEHNLEKLDVELKNQLYYHPSAPADILDEMEYQLTLTKRFILPALDKAVTIDSCIEHNFEINMSLTLHDDGCFGATYGNSYYSEGMLYFKTHKSVFEKGMGKAVSEFALKEKAFFEKVHNDPDLYSRVQAELERRKAANTEILRSYGLEI